MGWALSPECALKKVLVHHKDSPIVFRVYVAFCLGNRWSCDGNCIGIQGSFAVKHIKIVILHLQSPSCQSSIAVLVERQPLQGLVIYLHCKVSTVQVRSETLYKVHHSRTFTLCGCISELRPSQNSACKCHRVSYFVCSNLGQHSSNCYRRPVCLQDVRQRTVWPSQYRR